jgi:serine/threonine protein kinase
MSIPAGTRLGPYEIVSLIGVGGMGEVYRAKDTRLGRDVAIKVLPESFAADHDRRARFEREAQAVAALSHPNIVAVFDTGAHDNQVFVVMELLTGQTLRARLANGALPVKKAVDIAVQIARGLGAAHGKGIIHRELKPENVFLLEDGQVKILDFGLARRFGVNDGNDATRTSGTDPGTVMGTLGYMAPEQLRGQPTDARADVFSFGAVLYEMVSGHRAFQRDTAADTTTAILTHEPPEMAAARADVPPSLERIVRHCLEKNAAERFQNARDIAFALEALSGTGVNVPTNAVPVVAQPAAKSRGLWPVIAAVALIAGGLLGMFVERSRTPERAEIRFTPRTWASEWVTNARFTPDGQSIVYSSAITGSVPSLYVMRPGEVTPQELAGKGTHLLSVSSTGELAVLTGATNLWGHRVFSGTLSRMSATGGARAWMDHVTEADWAPDGSTLAIVRENSGTWQIEYPIGKVLYSVKIGYLSDPRVSPDGERVAFFEHQIAGDDRGNVKVVDRSGQVAVLTGDSTTGARKPSRGPGTARRFTTPLPAMAGKAVIRSTASTSAAHPSRGRSSAVRFRCAPSISRLTAVCSSCRMVIVRASALSCLAKTRSASCHGWIFRSGRTCRPTANTSRSAILASRPAPITRSPGATRPAVPLCAWAGDSRCPSRLTKNGSWRPCHRAART